MPVFLQCRLVAARPWAGLVVHPDGTAVLRPIAPRPIVSPAFARQTCSALLRKPAAVRNPVDFPHLAEQTDFVAAVPDYFADSGCFLVVAADSAPVVFSNTPD